MNSFVMSILQTLFSVILSEYHNKSSPINGNEIILMISTIRIILVDLNVQRWNQIVSSLKHSLFSIFLVSSITPAFLCKSTNVVTISMDWQLSNKNQPEAVAAEFSSDVIVCISQWVWHKRRRFAKRSIFVSCIDWQIERNHRRVYYFEIFWETS